MDREVLKKALGVRYIRLRFQVIMTEDTELPYYKSFALRGGIGEMLLRHNCVYDRDKCRECGFVEECIVKRVMYAKPEISIPFMTSGESLGYNLECIDHRTSFRSGDMLEFHLVLFGKCISYFWQYLQAVSALGMEGIGKAKAHFQIYQVLNIRKRPIVSGDRVHKDAYEWEKVSEYVERRLRYLERTNGVCEISFMTPATLKYQGEFLKEFQSDAFIKAILRRIYMMACFEGLGLEQMIYEGTIPIITSQEVHLCSIQRYSSTQNTKIPLKGMEGKIELREVSEILLACIAAGEVLHIGKNSSFGFGMYRVHVS